MITQRVIYQNNPLIEVIIQFRFPKILDLNTNDPVSFQNEIKDEYPIYQLAIEKQQEITFVIDQNSAVEQVPSIVQKQPVKNHTFISSDGTYKVNLTNEFISISTLAYHRWEEMLSHLRKPLSAFQTIYNPPFYERIGLRYIDAFSRNELGLNGSSWKSLINPVWLGAFACIEEDRVVNSGMDVEYYLDQKTTRAKIHTGLGTINNNTERVFIVDSDFIKIEMIKIHDGYSALEYLHKKAKEFIADVILEKLHFAMKPEDIE